ncbi:hypothetical protein LQW54_012123 [Pestalotiopsis sp. IQ-011]
MRADRPMILRLIEAGGDVNARPPWEDIPMKIRGSLPEEIRLTLSSHEGRTYRRTALQLAVEKGDLSITKLLLDHGADVNGPAARVRRATALQLACIEGCIDILQEIGRWTEEDEHLLKRTVWRDEWPDPHEREEDFSHDEVSEVDPDECKSYSEIFPYEKYEIDLEDYHADGEERDATRFVGGDSHEATNRSDRFGRSFESAQTGSRPWDEFLNYDADGEEEMF